MGVARDNGESESAVRWKSQTKESRLDDAKRKQIESEGSYHTPENRPEVRAP